MAYLTKKTIKGAEFEIGVTETGVFFAPVRDSKLEDRTMAGLIEKIEKSLKTSRIKIELPFVWWKSGQAPVRCVATGVHAANGRVLIRFVDGGGTDNLRPYRGDGAYSPPLPNDVIAEGQRLADVLADAKRELEAYRLKYVGQRSISQNDSYDLQAAVNEAMQRAVTE